MTSTGFRPILALLLLAGCGEPEPRFDVLVFSRTTAYRHAEAIEAGRAALEAMGAERGFAVEATEELGDLEFQRATAVVEDARRPATRSLPRRWRRTDEWYNFAPEPGRGAHVLLSLDERTYAEQDGTPAADEHPIAWTARPGRGRSLYSALGHGAEAWDEPHYRSHVLGALEWAAGD